MTDFDKMITAVRKTIREEINKQNDNKEHSGPVNYYKKTERLLYAYPLLKNKIKQDEEDLKNEEIVFKKRSKDIIKTSRIKNKGFLEIDINNIIESKIRSMERTKRQVERIEIGLSNIEHDEYYKIIELRYFGEELENETRKKYCDEEIADIINCDRTTVTRNRKRLIGELEVILFGTEAINF